MSVCGYVYVVCVCVNEGMCGCVSVCMHINNKFSISLFLTYKPLGASENFLSFEDYLLFSHARKDQN